MSLTEPKALRCCAFYPPRHLMPQDQYWFLNHLTVMPVLSAANKDLLERI